jgi:hypothetical protein
LNVISEATKEAVSVSSFCEIRSLTGVHTVRSAFLALLAASTFSITASAQVALNACDLNKDGAVNNSDVQLAVNMSLGSTPCTANVLGSTVCNVVTVQRVVNSALGGACVTGSSHSVALSWSASTSSNITGYNVYRSTTSGGPYTVVNGALVTGTTFTDGSVVAGQTYYYVTTAVDSGSNQSGYSNQAVAAIPTP